MSSLPPSSKLPCPRQFLPVLLFSMMPYGMEYPFGQLGQLSQLCPLTNFSCVLSLLVDTKVWETEKSLSVSTALQQPKHQCVTNIFVILNPKYSTVLLGRKLALSQLKLGRWARRGRFSSCTFPPTLFLLNFPQQCVKVFVVCSLTFSLLAGFFYVLNIFLLLDSGLQHHMLVNWDGNRNINIFWWQAHHFFCKGPQYTF